MGKWYKNGFQDALDGLPSDPPMHPRHRSYLDYRDGYMDGEVQLSYDAEKEAAEPRQRAIAGKAVQ